MKEYTFNEWERLSEKERAKHNTSVMQAAGFDETKVEFYSPTYNGWAQKGNMIIDGTNLYRLKPSLIKPTPEQQFQEPTQEEITAKFVKDNDLKIGDKLKVVRKFENKEWMLTWHKIMDKFIGKIGEIAHIDLKDIKVKFEFDNVECWYFLPQSLEVVKYRPFKDGAEFEKYYNYRNVQVREKGKTEIFDIIGMDNRGIITKCVYYSWELAYSMLEIINYITDETGEPFGVEI